VGSYYTQSETDSLDDSYEELFDQEIAARLNIGNLCRKGTRGFMAKFGNVEIETNCVGFYSPHQHCCSFDISHQ